MTPSYELTRCVVCGEADTLEIASAADIRAEAELLWEFHMRRLSPRTPPERLVDRVTFSQSPPWRVVRCQVCGLVYRNPMEKREALRETYTDAAPARDALLALHHGQRASFRVQAARLSRHLSRKGTGGGLEVGSYVGAFLAAARDAHWQFEGLDVNPHVNAFTRSMGFVVHDGDLEHFRPDRTFDAVAIWNTFDQLPDPRTAVGAAVRLLRPGGTLAIRVPNGECYARLRPHLTSSVRARRWRTTYALAANNLLTFPYRFGFSPAALTQLLSDKGFHVDRVVGDVLVPTADEWTRGWAVAEERMLKPLTKLWKPWFEMYATRGSA